MEMPNIGTLSVNGLENTSSLSSDSNSQLDPDVTICEVSTNVINPRATSTSRNINPLRPMNRNRRANQDSSDIIECYIVNNASEEYIHSNLDWINNYMIKCIAFTGTKCATKLDKLMEEFLVHVRREQDYCGRSPKRAFYISKIMRKCLIFFYFTFLDIKDFFITSRYSDIMVDLLATYNRMEMQATKRVPRGENDMSVSIRLANFMWSLLHHNEMSILNVLLKVGNSSIYSKRFRDFYAPMFRKILTFTKTRQFESEEDYIRVVLGFKTWKKLVYSYERAYLTECAISKVKKPSTFPKNYHLYSFLPSLPNGNNTDCHEYLVTTNVDLTAASENFFKYMKKKHKAEEIHCIASSSFNRHVFLDNFCKTFDGKTENSEDVWDTPLLDSINQDAEDLDEDDDAVIIEPQDSNDVIMICDDDEPLVMSIDLTAEEDDLEVIEPPWAEIARSCAEKNKTETPDNNIAVGSDNTSPSLISENTTTSTISETTSCVLENANVEGKTGKIDSGLENTSVELSESSQSKSKDEEETDEDNFVEPVSRFDYLSKLNITKKPVPMEALPLIEEIQNPVCVVPPFIQAAVNEKEPENANDISVESENMTQTTMFHLQESNPVSNDSSDMESPPFECLTETSHESTYNDDNTATVEIKISLSQESIEIEESVMTCDDIVSESTASQISNEVTATVASTETDLVKCQNVIEPMVSISELNSETNNLNEIIVESKPTNEMTKDPNDVINNVDDNNIKICDVQGSVTDWNHDDITCEERTLLLAEMNESGTGESSNSNLVTNEYQDNALHDNIEATESVKNADESIEAQESIKKGVVQEIIEEFDEEISDSFTENLQLHPGLTSPDFEIAEVLRDLKITERNFNLNRQPITNVQIQTETHLSAPSVESKVTKEFENTEIEASDKQTTNETEHIFDSESMEKLVYESGSQSSQTESVLEGQENKSDEDRQIEEERDRETESIIAMIDNLDSYRSVKKAEGDLDDFKKQVYKMLNRQKSIYRAFDDEDDEDEDEDEEAQPTTKQSDNAENEDLTVKKTIQVKQYRGVKQLENSFEEDDSTDLETRKQRSTFRNGEKNKLCCQPSTSSVSDTDSEYSDKKGRKELKSLLKPVHKNVSSKVAHGRIKQVSFTEIQHEELKIGKATDCQTKIIASDNNLKLKISLGHGSKSLSQKSKCISRVYKNKATIEHHTEDIADDKEVKQSDSEDDITKNKQEMTSLVNLSKKLHHGDHHKKRRNSVSISQETDSVYTNDSESIEETVEKSKRKRRNSISKKELKGNDSGHKHRKHRKSTSGEENDIDELTKDVEQQPRKRGRKKKKDEEDVQEQPTKSNKERSRKQSHSKSDIDEFHMELSTYIKKKHETKKNGSTEDTTKRNKKQKHTHENVESVEQIKNEMSITTTDGAFINQDTTCNVKISNVIGNYSSPVKDMTESRPKRLPVNIPTDKLALCKALSIKLIKDPLINSTYSTESTTEDNGQLKISAASATKENFVSETINEDFELSGVYNSSYSELSGATKHVEQQSTDNVNSNVCDSNVTNLSDTQRHGKDDVKEYESIVQPSVSTIPNSLFEKFVERTKISEQSVEVGGNESVTESETVGDYVRCSVRRELIGEVNKENEIKSSSVNKRKHTTTEPKTCSTSKSPKLPRITSNDVDTFDVQDYAVQKPPNGVRSYVKPSKYAKILTADEKYLMKTFHFDYDDLMLLDIKLSVQIQEPLNEEGNPAVILGMTNSGNPIAIKTMEIPEKKSLIRERQDYSKEINTDSHSLRVRVDKRPVEVLKQQPENMAPVQIQIPGPSKRGTCPPTDNIVNVNSLSLGNNLENNCVILSKPDKSVNINFPSTSNNVNYLPQKENNIPVSDMSTQVSAQDHVYDPSTGICALPICPLSEEQQKEEPNLRVVNPETLYRKDVIWENPSDNNLPNVSPVISDTPSISELQYDNFDVDALIRSQCYESSPCTSPEHETHLPIKKRRVSSLKVAKDELRDDTPYCENLAPEKKLDAEISYPSTPMISIAALENMKPRFRTPAELKEIPPVNPCPTATMPIRGPFVPPQNIQNPHQPNPSTSFYPAEPVIQLEQPLSINHTYNNPTINYHIGSAPLMNLHYPADPSMYSLPLIIPTSKNANDWGQSYFQSPQPVPSTSADIPKKKTQSKGRSKEGTTSTRGRPRKKSN